MEVQSLVPAKHPGGRPSKYRNEMIGKIGEYISMCNRENMQLPTTEGLCIYLGIRTTQLYSYAKKYSEFSQAIKEIAIRQKTQLMNDGMYGGKEVNAGMAIFLLKANHGMVETERKLISFDKDAPLNIEIQAKYAPQEVKSIQPQIEAKKTRRKIDLVRHVV